ncbi:glycosyltransferase family 8 protein [Lactobacillus helsingborgensis]|uniref:glycosyltransferase family 8 protein n=1 Tax=Lactobacillus helsingborgensis TaxID=1218494 RepID=UPI0016507BC7|nr:glycosyltransferase family 8 protein [Lactobacillus helsingborgensis]MBC6356003.1 glycosyltransferase family 8 protein [Lactobacillus helsingborgensis]
MEKQQKEPIEILVTIDQNYIKPLEVMMYSLKLNNLNENFRVWLIYDNINQHSLTKLKNFGAKIGMDVMTLTMNKNISFPDSLLNLHDYPKEMYFRLLSSKILPADLHRIIYLDPDILVINSIVPLWQLDLEGKMFAASVHEGLTDIMSSINNIRLGTSTGYFNSGIMLMDLDQMRVKINIEDITQAIEEHHDTLILPDQDILNYLYGEDILKIPETRWNYDARAFSVYLTRSTGEINTEWVMKNTSILHFCGKPKPWQKEKHSRFKPLYLNYQQMVNRLLKQEK